MTRLSHLRSKLQGLEQERSWPTYSQPLIEQFPWTELSIGRKQFPGGLFETAGCCWLLRLSGIHLSLLPNWCQVFLSKQASVCTQAGYSRKELRLTICCLCSCLTQSSHIWTKSCPSLTFQFAIWKVFFFFSWFQNFLQSCGLAEGPPETDMRCSKGHKSHDWGH